MFKVEPEFKVKSPKVKQPGEVPGSIVPPLLAVTVPLTVPTPAKVPPSSIVELAVAVRLFKSKTPSVTVIEVNVAEVARRAVSAALDFSMISFG